MKPTWETDDGKVRLYLADAREVLPLVEFDCVVTDPPFNVGYHYDRYHDALTDDAYQELLRQTVKAPSVVIHYPEDMFVVAHVIGEFPEKCAAWVYNANTPRQWRMAAWFGIEPDFSLVKQPYKNRNDARIRALIAGGSEGTSLYDWWNVEQIKNVSAEKTDHPCQMPLMTMRNIVGVTPGDTICDPFMGSGTTGVAAIESGKRFVGCEVDHAYFQIAVNRIQAELSRVPLFEPPPVIQRNFMEV